MWNFSHPPFPPLGGQGGGVEECLGFNLTLEKEQAYNEYLSKFEAKD